ncbi:MAG: glycosyltransferase [Alphaproteobacteria bacterium]|nr:glycosyltransferase [Alphaproteobacteria bacterium]
MNVAVVSHGHPALSPGGGERAAYAAFEYLKRHNSIERCTFFSYAKQSNIGRGDKFGAYHGKRDEILVSAPAVSYFNFLSSDYVYLTGLVDKMLAYSEPDIVHFHHFLNWGIESFEHIRRRGVRVILTLHEFIAICCRDGQMLRTNGRLCEAAYASDCANCFSNVSAGQFFVREKIIKAYLSYVDHFIAPSHFLAQRYVEWGLHPSKISVVENPLSLSTLEAASHINGHKNVKDSRNIAKGRIKIGYFGQINAYKGVDVLLRAVALLDQRDQDRLFIGIHGANLDLQTVQFQETLSELLSKASSCAFLMGSYDNARVLNLMDEYDWIIVPSIWWENSPVVIQEALSIGKSLICSNVGGMAEKGLMGRQTLFFEPGNIAQLASILSNLEVPAAAPKTPGAPTYAQCVDEIVSIYKACGHGHLVRF